MTDRKAPGLAGKEIVVGVCGSIAAYKAPELVRQLCGRGAGVTCLLTANGARFVSSLTLQTLSRNKVYEGMFDPFVEDIEHISLAKKADLILVAPATADVIARFAAGRADDLLSSTVLAAACPVLVCPAMNDKMWAHPATQANVQRLKSYGYRFVDPEAGALACGTSGTGRLAALDTIVQTVEAMLSE
jgi:phosphopantothenoylcysteine decarboxylase/phosphopantothenate--cysteine ligase